jgi:hypothetical protein
VPSKQNPNDIRVETITEGKNVIEAR